MKLIPMTDFVLEENKHGMLYRSLDQIQKYSRFLKQPLKLEMFVPCDEEGNVLDIHPNQIQRTSQTNYDALGEYENKYEAAKEKVLFVGFDPDMFDKKDNGAIVFNSKKWKSVWVIGSKTIEEIVYLNCILTPSAIKQLGL